MLQPSSTPTTRLAARGAKALLPGQLRRAALEAGGGRPGPYLGSGLAEGSRSAAERGAAAAAGQEAGAGWPCGAVTLRGAAHPSEAARADHSYTDTALGGGLIPAKTAGSVLVRTEHDAEKAGGGPRDTHDGHRKFSFSHSLKVLGAATRHGARQTVAVTAGVEQGRNTAAGPSVYQTSDPAAGS